MSRQYDSLVDAFCSESIRRVPKAYAFVVMTDIDDIFKELKIKDRPLNLDWFKKPENRQAIHQAASNDKVLWGAEICEAFDAVAKAEQSYIKHRRKFIVNSPLPQPHSTLSAQGYA